MKVIRNSIIPLGKRFGAINLFGLLFVKNDMKVTTEVINHEKIHSAQMRELGYIMFYVIYVIEWLLRLVAERGNNYKAYQKISFEREAYEFGDNLSYLTQRRHYAQWRSKKIKTDL